MSLRRILERKPVVLVLLIILFVAGFILLYYEVGEGRPLAARVIFPIIYVVLIILLLRTGLVPIPARYRHSILDGGLRLLDVAKAAGCMIASVLWIAVAVRFVSDTPVGVAILLGPAFIVLGTGACFLWKGLSGRSR
jgi:hypothetical protein